MGLWFKVLQFQFCHVSFTLQPPMWRCYNSAITFTLAGCRHISSCFTSIVTIISTEIWKQAVLGGLQWEEHKNTKKLHQLRQGSYLGGRELWGGVRYNNSCLPKYSRPGRWKHMNKWTKMFVIKWQHHQRKNKLNLAEGLHGKLWMLLSSPSLILFVLTTETAGSVVLAESSTKMQ